MKEKLYSDFLGLQNFDEIVENFYETLIDTNRGYKFFVDWKKVKGNISDFKVELNILNSLIGSADFDNDLRKILKKYPEVLPAIPILIAVRGKTLKVIRDFLGKGADIVGYNFNKRQLTDEEIKGFVEFFDKTGLKYFFRSLSNQSIIDYATGVEVGMDTNARKNRSGKAMELLLKPIIEQINSKLDTPFKVIWQKKFLHLEKILGIKVSSTIKNRKSDFILVKDKNTILNIEVNFYSGTGSKPQEIVDSYINRQNELKENNFKFIWVTDGEGWKGQKNQIEKGFSKIDYLLNLHFVRKGLLEKILCKI